MPTQINAYRSWLVSVPVIIACLWPRQALRKPPERSVDDGETLYNTQLLFDAD